MECEECLELKDYIRIKSPQILDECEQRATRFISSGILLLEKDNSWSSDYIEKIFACKHCGRRYILCAETYHGSGGEWKSLED